MRRFNATELFPGGSKSVSLIDLRKCGIEEGTTFQGLPYLDWLSLRDTDFLPPRLFSGLCALGFRGGSWLNLEDVTAWSDDTFAGTTLCNAITGNDAAKEACWEQADADSESMCECQLGTCASCGEEDSCSSHSWCAWEADDGALGGRCSDPLIAPTQLSFFECAHFCSHEVEGCRIPCVASIEDSNELWGRSRGQGWVWNGNFQSDESGGGWEWVDETCTSAFDRWYPNEPDGTDRCSAFEFNVFGEWFDDPCTWTHSCVCQPAAEPAVIDFDWLGGEIYGGGHVWICEEGMQPNALSDGCESCEAGKYSSGGIKCEPCAAGKFSGLVGSVSSDDCEQVSFSFREARAKNASAHSQYAAV
jgi:hypothetical protein